LAIFVLDARAVQCKGKLSSTILRDLGLNSPGHPIQYTIIKKEMEDKTMTIDNKTTMIITLTPPGLYDSNDPEWQEICRNIYEELNAVSVWGNF